MAASPRKSTGKVKRKPLKLLKQGKAPKASGVTQRRRQSGTRRMR